MSGGQCFYGCDCDECVGTVAHECGCEFGIGEYHQLPRSGVSMVIQRDQGDEDYYCWCGTRLAYLFGMNSWACPTHGLADQVYGPNPNAGRSEATVTSLLERAVTDWPKPVWRDENGRRVTDE